MITETSKHLRQDGDVFKDFVALDLGQYWAIMMFFVINFERSNFNVIDYHLR